MSQRGKEQGRREERVSGWIGGTALAALLLVFAAVVAWVTLTLRQDIRGQLQSRDAHVLSLLVRNQIARVESDQVFFFEFEELREEDIWLALLETASADGVFAIQLYDRDGALLRTSSDSLVGAALPPSALRKLEEGEAHSEYFESAWLSDFVDLGFASDREISALDVYVPLRTARSPAGVGVARYLIDGSVLAREFAVLDGRLTRQAGVAIGLGGTTMVALFWLAWRRLARANARVLDRTKRLKKANEELALLARTSAVGSVAAHLIHGLKNPLAGLRQVVAAQSSGAGALDEEDWRGAREAAERMQAMVQEVVGLLQDSASGASYEVSLAELESELRRRFAETASRRGIAFSCFVAGEGALASHRFNILALILSNLVQNALDAVGEKGGVTVAVEADGEGLRGRVSDDGPGVAPELRDALFAPVTSAKSGGAGIGLAISQQMARHLGGSLEYVEAEGGGAIFELRVPLDEAGSV